MSGLSHQTTYNRALKFGEKVGTGSYSFIAIGISRSSGIALALIAKGLGKGRELEAVDTERLIPTVVLTRYWSI